jgi:hypothetical protein
MMLYFCGRQRQRSDGGEEEDETHLVLGELLLELLVLLLDCR